VSINTTPCTPLLVLGSLLLVGQPRAALHISHGGPDSICLTAEAVRNDKAYAMESPSTPPILFLSFRGEGQRQQRFLLHFMRFGAAGGGAGAGAALD
jgi:hypothetical protein